MNFAEAREKMVDCQVRPCDVTDHQLLAAMLTVPREAFLDVSLQEIAYLDRDIQISKKGVPARYLMAATPLSKLIQLADPQPDNVVLVIGAGCGYGCAIFSSLALSVVGIEEDETLASAASENLSRLGYDNVVVLTTPLSEGLEREGPYDVIFLEGSVEEIPKKLVDQLAEGGRLVTIIGESSAAKATLYHKSNGLVGIRESFNCSAPRLPGFEKTREFAF
ncbi:MAG: protein-L-isoaspartate O-methyltransferase [Pseudomonadota bacterium]